MLNIDIYRLLNNWAIDPIRSIQSQTPGEYAAGNVFFIETEAGACYVLKRKTVHRTLKLEYDVLETLAAQGVPVAAPLRTRTGETTMQAGDEYFELLLHLPGAVYTDHYGPGAADRARQFGAAIARLHVALRECDPSSAVTEMDLRADIDRCSREIRPIWPADRPPLDPILAVLQAGLAAYYPALPKQLIHRDAHPGNILFQDGQLSGWLDFEIMLRGPRLFDLGYCSTSLLVSGLDDPAKRQAWSSLLNALVEGYETVSPLEPVERQALKTILLSIEVIFVAFFVKTGHPAGVELNLQALTWLYENL